MKSFDEAALEALRNASPVQPLPPTVACDAASMPVEFTFTYHIQSQTSPSEVVGWLLAGVLDPVVRWILVALTALTAFGLLWWLYRRERDALSRQTTLMDRSSDPIL